MKRKVQMKEIIESIAGLIFLAAICSAFSGAPGIGNVMAVGSALSILGVIAVVGGLYAKALH
ncbi:hypothetical protein E2N92_11545 [Methanofollis formosanus]|uniref:Uncharacterized protein n=1 Tax=Methanofollis formosanus TaxID=299308 RepID=A0A8G1EHH8_9EURY|nr:hypothetical protein [Methanofollis formosanus]QYZ80012.1 hypothetical protein E2N92_11545 [Methanofollis formosanus]